METQGITYIGILLDRKNTIGQQAWQRMTLLGVLAYEALSSFIGGYLLMAAPDGKLMNMSVDLMHGAFRDFLIPGIILFLLGILNAVAFVAVFRKSSSNWIMAYLALGGLAVWFWVEIIILQELHWLHLMWGMPVIVASLVAIPLVPFRNETIQRVLLRCGILSSLLYVAMNTVIPVQWEGYSSASHTVSELSAIGAPTRPLWVLFGIVYTFLVTAFGWGVSKSSTQNRPLHIAGSLLIAYGIVGMIWPLAPMHQREALAVGGATLSDTMHIVIATVTVLLMLLTMVFASAAFGKRFRFYSIISMALLLVFGVLAGLDAPKMDAGLPTPWIGVWERINIGIFLLWVVVLAFRLLRTEHNKKPMDSLES